MWKPLLLSLCLALASCSQVDVQTYARETPKLELREFFDGRVEGWGMFQKRSGEVVKRFHVVIDGRMDGDNLILDESFHFSDGSRQSRVWTLTPGEQGRWTGTAGDVVGEARGAVAGNTLHWRYVLSLPVDGRVRRAPG